MISKIRNSFFARILSVLFAFLIGFPMPGMAISGGPSQPEFTSFTPVEVTDMVDLFTGDFQYNIPLLEVEGYPVNLSYATGMGIEDPASCVGFGWTLNAAGVINRAVRGIPDDFSGDEITTETNIKPNWTVGVGIGGSVELIGFDFGEKIKNVNLNEFLKNDLSVKPNLNIGILYNNYTGLGYNASLGASVDAALAGNRVKLGAAGALGIGSESGLGVDGSLSASIDDKKNNSFINVGLTAGIGANTRGGLRQISIGMPITLGTDRFKKQERQVNSTGLSLKAAIPVGYSTYVPQATNAFHSYMISGDIAVGPEGKWSNFKGSINGYYSTQKLSSPQKTTPAYGYLYADKGMNNDGAMHDFNREKDGVYNENIPALPMTQMTYDVYTVSGQGISGMYRPHRDFGTVYDPYVYSSSNGNSIGGDIGIGDVTKVGINFSNTTNFSTTGRWSDGSNGSRNALSFNSQKAEKPDYESVYFKGAGEFSEIDMEYYNKIQQEYPVRMDINKSGRAFPVYKKRTSLINTNESNIDVSNNDRQKREPRNQVFSFLTFDEAEKGGFPVNIYNKDGNPVDQPVAGVDKREKHHIAEITINRPDGMRYIYGSQTYNYKQKEVTFNVAASSTNGSVTYKPGDNSTSNQNGKDNYYNSNTLPPHATAYQLTAIVSADYVDVEGDGLTPDDLGNYTNFTYTQYYNNENPYRWRNPEGGNRANFNDGFLCKKDDNKGTYIYGEKEVKMLRSIETKNYIAQFHYSPRFDAWDVAGENGGMGYNPLHKLDSIRLFSRHDLEKEQQSNKTYTATPIKTVHFTYNYSLCNGIPFYSEDGTQLKTGGKLTLEKVYFTYGNSQKGMLSPYTFTYNNNSTLMYRSYGMDRWGTYKNADKNPNALNNIDFPYTNQSKNETDAYASAWCLTGIQLPSGGEISVKYESDDYAYVEGERASIMLPILGFGKTPNIPIPENYSQNLYDGKNDNNQYIFFRASGVSSEQEFKERYFSPKGGTITEPLFFKFCIDLGDQSNMLRNRNFVENYEYVSGYVDIKRVGWSNGTGWIELPEVSVDDQTKRGATINPIAKEAMQFIRINVPDLFFGGNEETPNDDLVDKFNNFLVNVNDFSSIFRGGQHEAMRAQNFGRYVDTKKSFIRLKAPNCKKLGGGVRVKELKITDGWATMGGQNAENFSYGQTYKYTKTLEAGENGISKDMEISSGVASYEPAIGGEENSLHNTPAKYTEKNRMSPDNELYIDRPYGESFMPSPSVGYSRVVVENIQKGTGYTEHEFYTAKDFPVLIREPHLIKEPPKKNHLARLFKFNVEDNMTVSQSYAIELNDMHGKQKATRIYSNEADEQGNPVAISKVEYFYKTEPNNISRLSNKITVIDKEGKIRRDALAGITIDMTIDERESKSVTSSFGVKGNFDLSSIIPPVVVIPTISAFPSASKESTRFRSITNTKVITRYGILDRVEAEDLGAKITTKNLAWDAETGEVLLTRVENDFKDPVYSFTYPAHWGYDGMSSAYKNIGVHSNFIENGILPGADNHFTPGDEVLVMPYIKVTIADKEYAAPMRDEAKKGWITEITGNNITVLDRDGEEIEDYPMKITVLRSGRRNISTTPIGTVVTLQNPLQGDAIEFKEVLQSSAIEFASDWNGFCETCQKKNNNPYITGKKGIFRPKKSYAYLTGRTQSDYNRNTNMRKDGTFTAFSPFWRPNSGNDWLVNTANWTFTSEVTLFSPYGFELENMDALKRYTAALYGYNNTIPTAVAGNARYKEMGFTGFEDAGMQCPESEHFSFPKTTDVIFTEDQSHTGRFSIQVPPAKRVSMEKVLKECK